VKAFPCAPASDHSLRSEAVQHPGGYISQPKLLDFGIARLLDQLQRDPDTDRLLTPNYASPEQLRGATQTTATDVYSLGAVLYKTLAGRSPARIDTHTSQVVDVIAGIREIPAPSSLNRKLPADLDYILGKALRLEPEERYASVTLSQATSARCSSPGPLRRVREMLGIIRKFMRRYRVPVVASMLVIASLSAGLYIANRERVVAEQRFGQLRQLSNKVLTSTKRSVIYPARRRRDRPRVRLVEYLQGLVGRCSRDWTLAGRFSQGYWRVARIQGVLWHFNLVSAPKAEPVEESG